MRIDVQEGDKIIFRFRCSFAGKEINATGIVKSIFGNIATVDTLTGEVDIMESQIVAKVDLEHGTKQTILPFRGFYTRFEEASDEKNVDTNKTRIGA